MEACYGHNSRYCQPARHFRQHCFQRIKRRQCISEDLRQMVLDTAVEMGYQSKKMKKDENKKLCLFIENMEYETANQFGYEIILGFRQAAFRNGWSVSVVPVTPAFQMTEKYDTYMLKNGYSGGFLVGFALHDDWMRQLAFTSIPTVLFDNYIKKNHMCAMWEQITLKELNLQSTISISLGTKRLLSSTVLSIPWSVRNVIRHI